eukprot:GHVR01082175.1.p1 GENE.GHVR01082175.1~~GHVR01082175.1.p1  ORF type:complete len:152 (+),score=5.18 GHVR01082175.1:34-456(+)
MWDFESPCCKIIVHGGVINDHNWKYKIIPRLEAQHFVNRAAVVWVDSNKVNNRVNNRVASSTTKVSSTYAHVQQCYYNLTGIHLASICSTDFIRIQGRSAALVCRTDPSLLLSSVGVTRNRYLYMGVILLIQCDTFIPRT